MILQDPTLRMVHAGTFLFGLFIASVGPYQSLVAVEVFGISDPAYAAILMMALVVFVAAAIGIGIVTDQRPSRRQMALLAAASMAAGGLTVWFGASIYAFILATVVFLPISGTIMGQYFAVNRLATARFAQSDRDAILATQRATMGVPWIVALPVWGYVLDGDVPLLAIYISAGLCGVVSLWLILRYWPRDEDAPWTEIKSGLGFRDSLAELMAGPILLRVMLMGAVHAGGALTGVLLGLIFAGAGRGPADVGLFFGILVAFEVLGMLMLGWLVPHFRRLHLIAAGTVIYAIYLFLLPVVAGGPLIWGLTALVGVGGGLIFALAIGYLQDLLGQRAGAGASLMSLQRVAADGLCAGIFALGAWAGGYGLVAVMGGFTIIMAMGAILWLDARQNAAPI
jgi:MFS transporter, SET family, sugar efflux transporter